MDNTLTHSRVSGGVSVRSVAISVAIAVAIALSIAAAYYALCMLNPALAKSSVAGVSIGKTFRIANTLRAFSLATPAGAMGVALGGMAFNAGTGTFALNFGYLFMPFLHLIGGLGVFFASRKIGRSVVNDLSLLALYGLFMGVMVTINLASFALLVNNETWSALFTAAAVTKIGSNIIITMAGYPLVRGAERLISYVRGTTT